MAGFQAPIIGWFWAPADSPLRILGPDLPPYFSFLSPPSSPGLSSDSSVKRSHLKVKSTRLNVK
jgi:hypothetical protein